MWWAAPSDELPLVMGLEKMFISLQGSQNFLPVWPNFPPVWHISLMYFFIFSVKITKNFPARSFLLICLFFPGLFKKYRSHKTEVLAIQKTHHIVLLSSFFLYTELIPNVLHFYFVRQYYTAIQNTKLSMCRYQTW